MSDVQHVHARAACMYTFMFHNVLLDALGDRCQPANFAVAALTVALTINFICGAPVASADAGPTVHGLVATAGAQLLTLDWLAGRCFVDLDRLKHTGLLGCLRHLCLRRPHQHSHPQRHCCRPKNGLPVFLLIPLLFTSFLRHNQEKGHTPKIKPGP